MLKNGLSEESTPTSIRLPRIMIAAEKSGGGKTFFTCVLLSLLKERIEAVRPDVSPDGAGDSIAKSGQLFCGGGYAAVSAGTGSSGE